MSTILTQYFQLLVDVVISSDGTFVLVRRIVEGAAHPGRRKKKGGMG
jgi:hypothetical protein